ncbi:hypothetical protein KO527_18580 [Pseudoalteromonas sp. C2R02]|uniref:hypothetical protein n=1 Tax=Pseudoalteromonas sp. C2R02 TaxID=2841565 RepID=UPI001C0861B6|nr:hypothetical protein [Pseudoalteromonas sp. C2R02]MBU2971351.1 hypothetical protein [Pseudoalteromonas sp. C2R02]
MYRFINWLTTSLALPLVPMFGVWLLKGIEKGSFSTDSINGTDLLFASAMICVISLIRLKKVANKDLLEGLTNIISFGLVVSMVLFAWSLVYLVQADITLTNYFSVASKAITDGTDVKKALGAIDPLSYNNKIETFRVIGFIVMAVVVPTSILFNYKYDLDK